GLDAIRGDAAFILHEDGLGWLYVASGLQDGPMPTHYEPLESPVHNALYSRDTNPAVHWFTRQENRFAPPGDPRFPFVLTTYRLTEHHTAGGMSRFLSHLAELQPERFAEFASGTTAAGRALRQSRWWSRPGGKDRQSMIGEGLQSTNQRKHSYVQDHVEVGFFTDPSVCIGCKACEVACKEWNQVPDD